MTKKHVHCDVIKAWAEGAEIQWTTCDTETWHDCADDDPPMWYENVGYRVKPTPKPDLILFYDAQLINGVVGLYYHSPHDCGIHNLKLVFDSDTGVLKEAEVVK